MDKTVTLLHQNTLISTHYIFNNIPEHPNYPQNERPKKEAFRRTQILMIVQTLDYNILIIMNILIIIYKNMPIHANHYNPL